VEGVRRLRVSSVLLDGEGVICDDNGLAILDRLHSKQNDGDAFHYTFELLELDGEDWRAPAAWRAQDAIEAASRADQRWCSLR
jgi:hypothetical protein